MPRLPQTTDAGVGALVEQEFEFKRKPMAFFSAKLSPAQRKSSTFSRELLTIYLTIRHFRHLLEGKDFSVYTEHKPLTTAMSTCSDKYTSREIRQLDYLSQFTTDIRHVKEKYKSVADVLSRTETHSLEKGVLSQDLITIEQNVPRCADEHLFEALGVPSMSQRQPSVLRCQPKQSEALHSPYT